MVTTTGPSAVSTSIMETCNHEVADIRMLVHVQDALDNAATICLVCTVDTDVVIVLKFSWKVLSVFLREILQPINGRYVTRTFWKLLDCLEIANLHRKLSTFGIFESNCST